MSTKKMKGLLRGLRYISQIFETEKEQDMVIGYPTDVKHVAHIGWDGGPSSVTNDPRSEGGSTENNGSKADDGQPPRLPDMPRSSRRQPSGGGGSAAVTSDQSDGQKRSRRHHSSSSTSSLPKEGAGKSKPRQLREASGQGSESPRHSSTSEAPKKHRPKKSKDSSKDGKSEGSSRRARSQTSQDSGCDFNSAGLEKQKKYNEV